MSPTCVELLNGGGKEKVLSNIAEINKEKRTKGEWQRGLFERTDPAGHA